VRFPVNFLPIHQELAPLLPHLRGRVLNAGCGDRDISAFLRGGGATAVDNCDIASSIPGAFLCDLTSIPRTGGSYDAILCNAVLEHVPDPEAVMAEFHRLLVPEGRLVVAVPFLQPEHPTPLDFRRYTRSGLARLGERAGFRVLEMRSVHSLAQTLGWLLWSHLEERRCRVGKLLLWLPIYATTRLVQRGPTDMSRAANAFQAVMVRA
jgi:SAM-dependent methyltransferase